MSVRVCARREWVEPFRTCCSVLFCGIISEMKRRARSSTDQTPTTRRSTALIPSSHSPALLSLFVSIIGCVMSVTNSPRNTRKNEKTLSLRLNQLISRERQRERERRLEARIAKSEEARIEVEAEAGRLQAFLDEMRGLGPLFVQPRRGGENERAAE